jgi:hypothetical protein
LVEIVAAKLFSILNLWATLPPHPFLCCSCSACIAETSCCILRIVTQVPNTPLYAFSPRYLNNAGQVGNWLRSRGQMLSLDEAEGSEVHMAAT